MHKLLKIFSSVVIIILIIIIVYIAICLFYKHQSTRNLLKQYQQEEKVAKAAAKHNVAFKAEKKFPPHKTINILVLEGGGVEGILSMNMLAYLEKESHKQINQLFDVIAGVSIGGLQTAALTVPDASNPQKAKYSAQELLNLFNKEAPQALKSSTAHKLMSGLGLITPIIDPQNYSNLLKKLFDNNQLSQLKNTVLLFGFDLPTKKIVMFSNRGNPNKANYLVRQLILANTSIPGIFPARKLFAINKPVSYLLTDPTVVMNNPIISTIFYINKLYPNNPKRLIFIGLAVQKPPKTNLKKMSNNGLLSSIGNYQAMVSQSRNAMDRLFLGELVESHHQLQLKPKDTFFVYQSVPFKLGSPINASPQHIAKLNKISHYIIDENKKTLNDIVKQLTTSS